MKRQALRASLWSAGDALSRQGLQFVTTVVLARLLTPADFGVVAMLAVFVGVAGVLADGGFSVALIQRQDVDRTDESTVFWCNLGLGTALAIAMACMGPMLASFFGEPRLKQLACLMSVAVFAGAAGGIHFALLNKMLDFRTQAVAGGIAAVISGAVAIAMAIRGFGVWALAAQAVIMAAMTSLLLWLLHPWRPAWTFSRASVRKLAGFGSYHLASTLMETAYVRLYTLLVGRRLGADPVGYYAYAENTRQLPASFIGSLVARVALPMFARAQDDPRLMQRGVQFSIRVMMLAYAPLMLAMAALAEPIVAVLYGARWQAAVPMLRILAVAGLIYPLHMINLYALMAQGHARLMFRLELVKKVLGVALMLAGLRYGLLGLAWSQLLHSVLVLGINTRYSKRMLGYGMLAQSRDAAPPALVAATVAAVVAWVSKSWVAQPLPELVVLLAAGGIGYAGLVVLTRMAAWEDAKGLVKQLVKGESNECSPS